MIATDPKEDRYRRRRRSGGLVVVALRPLALLLMLSSIPFLQSSAQNHAADTLRVLTYNLHGLLQDGANPNWDSARTARLLDAIQELNPDVVGFQEVLQQVGSEGMDNQIRALADSLSKRTGLRWDYRAAVAHRSWDRFDEGIAILARHPIVSSKEYLLQAQDVFRRNLLQASVRTSIGEIDFYTTHLAHRTDAEKIREAQVAEIKRHVGRMAREGIPAIVVGDFNAEPDRPSVRLMGLADSTSRLVDAFAAVHPDDAGYTFSAEQPSRRIDYVFVTETAHLVPVNARTLFGESIEGEKLSDHLGVYVEFVTNR